VSRQVFGLVAREEHVGGLVAREEHVGEVCVGEFKVSLVVELHEGGRIGMLLLEVQIMDLGLFGRVPAVLAHVHLASPLLVFVLMGHPVNFQAVAFQATPLGERLLT